jgi:hypothetical protein
MQTQTEQRNEDQIQKQKEYNLYKSIKVPEPRLSLGRVAKNGLLSLIPGSFIFNLHRGRKSAKSSDEATDKLYERLYGKKSERKETSYDRIMKIVGYPVVTFGELMLYLHAYTYANTNSPKDLAPPLMLYAGKTLCNLLADCVVEYNNRHREATLNRLDEI